MTLPELAGGTSYLLFIASIATFALTRWERRQTILVTIDAIPAPPAPPIPEENNGAKTVRLGISLMNVGVRAEALDLRTLRIRRGAVDFFPFADPGWETEDQDIVLPPNGKRTFTLSFEAFLNAFEIERPECFSEKSFNQRQSLLLRVKSVQGRLFFSYGQRYEEQTGRFYRD